VPTRAASRQQLLEYTLHDLNVYRVKSVLAVQTSMFIVSKSVHTHSTHTFDAQLVPGFHQGLSPTHQVLLVSLLASGTCSFVHYLASLVDHEVFLRLSRCCFFLLASNNLAHSLRLHNFHCLHAAWLGGLH